MTCLVSSMDTIGDSDSEVAEVLSVAFADCKHKTISENDGVFMVVLDDENSENELVYSIMVNERYEHNCECEKTASTLGTDPFLA